MSHPLSALIWIKLIGKRLFFQHGCEFFMERLPLLEQEVYLEIRPLRFQCRECEGWPEAEIVIDRFHVAKNDHHGVDQLRQ